MMTTFDDRDAARYRALFECRDLWGAKLYATIAWMRDGEGVSKADVDAELDAYLERTR